MFNCVQTVQKRGFMKININYNYKYPKKSKSIIQCSIKYEGKRIQLSTGISVEKKDWDEKNFKVRRTDEQAINKNQILKSIDSLISDYYFKQKAMNDDVNENDIKEIFYKTIQVDFNSDDSLPSNKLPTLIETYEQYLKEKSESGKYSEGTIKNNQNCLNHLIAFAKYKRTLFDWENLNKKFFDDFLTYLNKKQQLTNDSAKKQLTHFKTFWNSLDEDKIPNFHKVIKLINQSKNSVSNNNSKHIVALDEHELKLIQDYQPNNVRLENVKDLFLLQIYLGVRVSDLMAIAPSNIDFKNKILRFFQKKTKDFLYVPIHSKVEGILKKYPEGLPKYSDQKYRDYIKELCKNVGIEQLIPTQKIYGSKVVKEDVSKWKLISSHTARRTFATLLSKKGVNQKSIMKFTGHKSIKTFEQYIRITDTEALNDVSNAWDD